MSLFNKKDLNIVINKKKQKIKDYIDKLNLERLENKLNNIDKLYNKYKINPLVLYNKEVKIHKVKEKIKEVVVTIGIPYKGDKDLFYLKPSTFTLGGFNGDIKVNMGNILLDYASMELNSKQILNNLNKDIELIKKYIQWQSEDIELYNKELKEYIENLLCDRKNKLLKDLNLVASLGIPLRESEYKFE